MGYSVGTAAGGYFPLWAVRETISRLSWRGALGKAAVSNGATAYETAYEVAGFETVAETEVDSRGRVSLGKAGAKPGRRYRVESNIDGVLMLIPVVSIPEGEMIIWRNPPLMQQIREGLEDADRGETVDRGSFEQYLDDDEDDEDQ